MTTGVLTTSFPRFPGDFAGCFVEDAVRAQAAEGEIVEVIAAGAPGPAATQAAARRLDLLPAIRVWRVGSRDGLPVADPAPLFFGAGAPEHLEAGGVRAWTQAALFWAALCQQARARVGGWTRVVAHWLVPSALAARAIAPRLPLTAYAHSGDVSLLERLPGGAALARRLARQIDDLVFVSGDLQRRFGRLTGGTVGRVDPLPRPHVSGGCARRSQGGTSFAPAPAPPYDGGRTVLSVGRLVPIKGYDVLVRAVARSALGPVTVVILGEGPERQRLEDLARRLVVDLRLPGCVARGEVSRWLSAADLYVQPSRRLVNGRVEGRPTATLEAVEAGLPTLVSCSGGLAEIPGVALVPPDDIAALAAALSAHLGIRHGRLQPEQA